MQIKQTNQKSKKLTIYKYNESQLILIDPKTRQLFQYHQNTSQPSLNHLIHESLITPIQYDQGLLYPLAKSTLQIELTNRKNSHQKIYYTQQQLVETFRPIIDCLNYIHSNGIIYGKLSRSSITLNNQAAVKLQHWNYPQRNNAYYSNKNISTITKYDDLKVLGLIMLECATLTNKSIISKSAIQQQLITANQIYQKNFILGLIILIFKLEKYQNEFLHLFNDNSYTLKERKQELDSIYIKLMQKQDKKYIEENNRVLQRKYNIDFSKFNNKHTSLENQKLITEVRKNCQEKVHKIIERSSAFVNELISKRNQQFKKMSSYSSYKGSQNSQLKKNQVQIYPIILNSMKNMPNIQKRK